MTGYASSCPDIFLKLSYTDLNPWEFNGLDRPGTSIGADTADVTMGNLFGNIRVENEAGIPVEVWL